MKLLEVFKQHLLEEHSVSIYDKDILRSTPIENPLTVAHKEERERATKDHPILLAKKISLLVKQISHQNVPNHGLFNVLQLLGSPQNSQTFEDRFSLLSSGSQNFNYRMLHFAAGQRCPLPIWQQGGPGGGRARWDERPHEKPPGNLREGGTIFFLQNQVFRSRGFSLVQ